MPTLTADFFSANEDQWPRLSTNANSGVLANDDAGGGVKGHPTLSAWLVSGPVNPLFDMSTNGGFVYDTRYHGVLYLDESTGFLTTADPIDAGADDFELENGFDSLGRAATIYDSFVYGATDGLSTSTETATITIHGVNDAPVAVDDSRIIGAGAQIIIDAAGNDTDVDIWPVADDLNVTLLYDVNDANGSTSGTGGDSITTNEGGTVEVVNGQIVYTAAAGFFGVDTFEYVVSDGLLTDRGTVRITVLPANDDPTAVNDTGEISEDAGSTLSGSILTGGASSVLANDTDPDTDLLGAIYTAGTLRAVDGDGNTIAGDPTGILVDFNADGTFEYDPNGEFEYLGDDDVAYVAFDYQALDAEGVWSTATVTLTINGVNDPVSGTIGEKEDKVYEAGLSDGSGEGPGTTTMVTFDFTADLMSTSDPEGDAIFLVVRDGSGEGRTDLDAGDTIAGTYGTYTLLDNYDNATGLAGTDGLVDGVSYTLNDNAPHADVAGHNGGVFDDLDLGFTDGTLNGDETAYVLDFTGSGGTNNVTGVNVEIIDDIVFLGTLDPLDNKTVTYGTFEEVSDTFTYIPGADGASLSFSGIPNQFTVENGTTDLIITSTVSTDGLTVTGKDQFGNDWYTIVINPDFDTTNNLAQWTYTQVQGPAAIRSLIDFSSVKAGGPQEVLSVPLSGGGTVSFDGFLFDANDGVNPDGTGLSDVSPLEDPTSSDDVNPNNAGGIGVGNGNVQQYEGLMVDFTQAGSSDAITGISFDLTRVGGNPPDQVTVIYEVVLDDGGKINGTVEVDFSGNPTNNDVEVVDIEPLIPAGKTIANIFFAIDPADIDGNDNFRINTISTLSTLDSPDYELSFSILADEGTVDGDTDGPDSFTILVDGLADTLALTSGLDTDFLL